VVDGRSSVALIDTEVAASIGSKNADTALIQDEGQAKHLAVESTTFLGIPHVQ
jgi:hypothetical protein